MNEKNRAALLQSHIELPGICTWFDANACNTLGNKINHNVGGFLPKAKVTQKTAWIDSQIKIVSIKFIFDTNVVNNYIQNKEAVVDHVILCPILTHTRS